MGYHKMTFMLKTFPGQVCPVGFVSVTSCSMQKVPIQWSLQTYACIYQWNMLFFSDMLQEEHSTGTGKATHADKKLAVHDSDSVSVFKCVFL